MFDIGWSEMAVIALVVIIVIGPKDLPHVLRAMGRWMRKVRAMTREFQSHVDEMVREAELDDLKKQVESAGRYDIGGEIERTIDPTGEMRHAFDPTKDGGGTRKAKPPAEGKTETGSEKAPAEGADERKDERPAPASESRPVETPETSSRAET